MSRALDEQCARALGFQFAYRTWRDPFSGWAGKIDAPPPSFSTDPSAVRLLEDDIERRGLQAEYVTALLTLVHAPVSFDENGWDGISGGSAALDYWAIRRATPEQCARAYLHARGLL